MNPHAIAKALGGQVVSGSVVAPGPGHGPRDRSLSVKVDDTAPDGFLVHSFAGDDPLACKDYVRDALGKPSWQPSRADPKPAAHVVARHIYTDAEGAPVMRVIRREPKAFSQEKAVAGGGWEPGGVPVERRVPYRLSDGLEAIARGATIYVVEGEKTADRMAREGLAATCSPGGAGKWPTHFADHFAGADVVILPDNDEPGEAHAAMVKANLAPVAASVRIINLPGLPDKGDPFDWLEAGGRGDDIAGLPADDGRISTLPDRLPTGGAGDDATPAPQTEDALADIFTGQHADDWRYVAAWGRWLTWTGAVWVREDTLRVYEMARLVCRASARDAAAANLKARLSSAATIAAVERIARADRRHAQTSDAWDGDPWALNTPAGVVDLRTGITKAHDRQSLMTKIAGASPQGDCPVWREFLATVTGGDVELQLYLQRVVGYCLTGETNEHALFFLYGTGANGKSVFANTLSAMMDDYATGAAIDMFMASHGDRHPTDMASLRGARVVTAVETEQGSRWAESKLKALTGGDKITARFMRQDFFEYTPQFKLLVIGNHKPAIRSVDEAMRRRLHMIPFAVTIPAARRDKRLPEKLLSEHHGIMAWAVEGCLEWQRIGLAPPASVLAATEEYFEAEDAFGRWLEERCSQARNLHDTSARLYADWTTWAAGNGEFATSNKRFSETLTARGFERANTMTARGFRGLKLRWAPTSTDPAEV